MSYYITRIFNNKLKLGIILYIFIAPIIDILLTLIDLSKGASVPAPYLATFLGGFSIGGLRKLFMWYLPLPLAIVVADDCIEDYKIGYKNILVTKRGKNKYFVLNILKSFVISFLIIIIPLLLNLLMVHIVFAGGTYLFMDPESIKAIPSMAEYYSHPMFYNLLCILLLSLTGGVVGSGATALAMAFPNRFILYPLIFILWYIPSIAKQSIMMAFQPFTEYPLSYALPSVIFVLATNVVAVLFSFLIEAVSVVAALICFDINLILELNFLQYSALELLTLFLFYFRAGLVMLSFGIIISPKVAPFITIALYLIELFATIIFMISKVWLPFRDSVVVPKLMHGEMVLSDMWGIILRALLMMFMLIFSSYFLYQKKDVLSNVKK